MRVEVFTAVSAFQDLRAEWRQVLSQLPFQSVFFTPQWQETWWRHFGATRQLHLLTVRASDGTLQGLAPLMSSPGIDGTSRLELLGDLELCDEPYAALQGADALAVVTEWKAFRSPEFDAIRVALKTPVLFDGRNLYDPEVVEGAGLAYYGIGRGRSVSRPSS